jgi:hypothetical protein
MRSAMIVANGGYSPSPHRSGVRIEAGAHVFAMRLSCSTSHEVRPA